MVLEFEFGVTDMGEVERGTLDLPEIPAVYVHHRNVDVGDPHTVVSQLIPDEVYRTVHQWVESKVSQFIDRDGFVSQALIVLACTVPDADGVDLESVDLEAKFRVQYGVTLVTLGEAIQDLPPEIVPEALWRIGRQVGAAFQRDNPLVLALYNASHGYGIRRDKGEITAEDFVKLDPRTQGEEMGVVISASVTGQVGISNIRVVRQPAHRGQFKMPAMAGEITRDFDQINPEHGGEAVTPVIDGFWVGYSGEALPGEHLGRSNKVH